MIQQQAFEILKFGSNVYLTGSAGSGKTFLLNRYIGYLRSKKVAVGITASTGIAATHLGGMTIHSWSGLGVRDVLSVQDCEKLLKRRRLVRRFNRTDVLIIDEVSMLHAHQLDLVDRLCRLFRDCPEEPFGGMQVVLCGDFFQLPPVSRAGQAVNFINKSRIWQNMDLRVCYLEGQYRHKDDVLTGVLNDIRTDNVGERTLAPLRERYQKDVNGAAGRITKLYTHNIDVDAVNNRELAAIPGKVYSYTMQSRGNKQLVESLKKGCLAPEVLRLKKGAKVMFVKNHPEGEYVNGTLGTVEDFSGEGCPVVKTFKEEEIAALPVSWKIEEDGKVNAEIMQVPLRLAWAITVHKSQGMTLDAAETDISKSFVEGMGYVALSRVKSLQGLKLMGLNKMALRVNQDILQLDKELKEMSQRAAAEFAELNAQKKEKLRKRFVCGEERELSTYEKTKSLVLEKLPLEEIAKRRGFAVRTIIGHIDKLAADGDNIDIFYLQPPKERFERIREAFKECGDERLKSAFDFLREEYSYDEIGLVRAYNKLATERN